MYSLFFEERTKLSIKDEEEKRRKEDRVPVSLPVNMASAKYVTRDISPSGVYLEADASFGLGDRIDFVVEFGNLGGNLLLKCNGEIVRVENKNGKIGVAVKILDSVMVST